MVGNQDYSLPCELPLEKSNLQRFESDHYKPSIQNRPLRLHMATDIAQFIVALKRTRGCMMMR